VIELAEAANRSGAQLRPQITPRSVGVLFSLAASSLIDDLPSFQPFGSATLHEKVAALRSPEVRDRIISEGAGKSFGAMYLMPADGPVRYNYDDADAIDAIAAARGVSPVEAYIDEMDRSNGRSIVNWPVMNQNESAIEEMVRSEVTILGLADGGAHATQIMDASQPTYFLSHWVRDRGVLGLEEGVRRLTSDTANFIGYRDRGVLAPGAFADVNVINLEELSLTVPEIVHDFPGNAPRFIQGARGIDHTIINGVPFMAHGQHTGDLAGRILRSTD
jgi:hypothetical protein